MLFTISVVTSPLPGKVVVVAGGHLHLMSDQDAGSGKGFGGVALAFLNKDRLWAFM